MSAKAVAAKTWSGGEQVTDTKVYSMFGSVVPSSSPTRYDMAFSTGLSAAECASTAGLVVVSSSAPSDTKNAWFDSTLLMLRIYDGTLWQPVNGCILTYRTAGTSTPGDLVIVDTANANSVVTTTTAASTKVVGIIREAVAQGSQAVIQTFGKAKVNTDGTAAVGEIFGTGTTAGKAANGSGLVAGRCGMILGSGMNLVDCLLFGRPSA